MSADDPMYKVCEMFGLHDFNPRCPRCLLLLVPFVVAGLVYLIYQGC